MIISTANKGYDSPGSRAEREGNNMKYRPYQLIGDCYTEPTYTEAPYWKSKKQIKEYIEKTYNEKIDKLMFIESNEIAGNELKGW